MGISNFIGTRPAACVLYAQTLLLENRHSKNNIVSGEKGLNYLAAYRIT
jgi:hypothetical protein